MSQEPETEAEVVSTEGTAEAAAEEITALSMSMKKEELLEAAKERGVKVSARATKAAIIEAIEKAAEATDNE
jgi:post-segregation antitoxin (ccd killing protein)